MQSIQNPFVDRTAQYTNTAHTRSQIQSQIDRINNELDQVVEKTKPLLEEQRRLKVQYSQLDPKEGESGVPVETLTLLHNFESEVSKVLSDYPGASPLKKTRQEQEKSPVSRNRGLKNHGSIISRRQRHSTSSPRHHDIDLATELGEGLVEEVRRLQAQLHEKDELLKEHTKVREKQDRGLEETESRFRALLLEEEKLKSVNWELELRLQEAEELHKTVDEARLRTEVELTRLTAFSAQQADQLEALQDVEQRLTSRLDEMRSANVHTIAGQKEVHDDLRGEIATLQRRLDNAKTDLESQRRNPLPSSEFSSPHELLTQADESEDEPETPPGSPPLSPIKGTPHRNASLETETMRGTLYYNQAKMLRQRKELEREKTHRMQLQRQLQDVEDELESLRQLRDSQVPQRRRNKASGSAPQRRETKDLLVGDRRPVSEITVLDDWEDEEGIIERSHSNVGDDYIKRQDGHPYDDQTAYTSDTGHRRLRSVDVEGSVVRRTYTSTQAESELSGSEDSVRSESTTRGDHRPLSVDQSISSIADLRSFSASSSRPKDLQAELEGLSGLDSPGTSRMVSMSITDEDLPKAEYRIETKDASTMTDSSWGIMPVRTNNAAVQEADAMQKSSDLIFVYEDPTNVNRAFSRPISNLSSISESTSIDHIQPTLEPNVPLLSNTQADAPLQANQNDETPVANQEPYTGLASDGHEIPSPPVNSVEHLLEADNGIVQMPADGGVSLESKLEQVEPSSEAKAHPARTSADGQARLIPEVEHAKLFPDADSGLAWKPADGQEQKNPEVEQVEPSLEAGARAGRMSADGQEQKISEVMPTEVVFDELSLSNNVLQTPKKSAGNDRVNNLSEQVIAIKDNVHHSDGAREPETQFAMGKSCTKPEELIDEATSLPVTPFQEQDNHATSDSTDIVAAIRLPNIPAQVSAQDQTASSPPEARNTRDSANSSGDAVALSVDSSQESVKYASSNSNAVVVTDRLAPITGTSIHARHACSPKSTHRLDTDDALRKKVDALILSPVLEPEIVKVGRAQSVSTATVFDSPNFGPSSMSKAVAPSHRDFMKDPSWSHGASVGLQSQVASTTLPTATGSEVVLHHSRPSQQPFSGQRRVSASDVLQLGRPMNQVPSPFAKAPIPYASWDEGTLKAPADLTDVMIPKREYNELKKQTSALAASQRVIELLTKENSQLINASRTRTTPSTSPRFSEIQTAVLPNDRRLDRSDMTTRPSTIKARSPTSSSTPYVPGILSDSETDGETTILAPHSNSLQLESQQSSYSPTAKAERVLGLSPGKAGLSTSKSISRSLRSSDMGMAPPLKPSTARDTVRSKKTKGRPSIFNYDQSEEPDAANKPQHGYAPTTLAPPRSYSSRSLSSVSSFASEIDDRFNQSFQMPGSRRAVENPTDPATIESITRTMIGMSMYKYTRRAGRQGLSENRHKRYFWIHPYTKTLYWSVYNPVNAPEGAIIKSAPIVTFYVEEDYNTMPPGLHQRSICVATARRTIKMTAIQVVDHEDWVRSLNFLIYGPSPDDKSPDAVMETDAAIRDFSPGRRSVSRSPSRKNWSPSSQQDHFQVPGMLRNGSLRVSPKLSQNSLSSRVSALFSKPSATVRRQSPVRAASRHRTPLQAVSFENELTLDDISDGSGLENVRACCGGRHDVSDLCTRPRAASRTSSRGPP